MEIINKKLDLILEKLSNLEKINNINNINNISDNIVNDLYNINSSYEIITKKLEYRELKVENFELDQEFVKTCLLMNSINGDIRLFKKMYIDDIPKEYYPIRHIKKKFQYWINNHMEDDHTNGKYIKDVIIKNIETCYLKINTYENFGTNAEQFMKNQEHIDNITEQKYQDKFLTQITNILNI